MAHPANTHVIRAVHRDAVPGQRAIGGQEFVAAGAGVGRGRNGPRLQHLDLIERDRLGAVYGDRVDVSDFEAGGRKFQAIFTGGQRREAEDAIRTGFFFARIARAPIRGRDRNVFQRMTRFVGHLAGDRAARGRLGLQPGRTQQ